ncbi:MAG: response regulator [Clostridiales bacterium]|jgi:DNA-binding NarL/FixJ family response regulator|nr:response regulator [Clostridiales bacterium]
MNKLRVFVADDSHVARSMLIRMLNDEEDIDIVGEAGTTQSSVMMLDEVNPDVILLEAAISGGMSIARLIRSIKDIKPYIRIILCVELNVAPEMMKAAELWASDVIRKPYNKTNLLRAIRNV